MTSPVAVRVAAGVLVVMALGGLVYGAIGLALMSGIVERFQTAAIGAGVPVDDIDGGSQLLRGVPIAAAFVGVVSALLLAALVVGLLRGNSGVRVATWVVCGLGLVGGALSASVGFVQRIDEVADDAMLSALNEAHRPGGRGQRGPFRAATGGLRCRGGAAVVAGLLRVLPAHAVRHPPARRRAPRPVDPADWQRPQPPTTTPAAM